MKKLTITQLVKSITCMMVLLPSFAFAGHDHNHNHNHFTPALEALGHDIIGLTVCYNNGYLSDKDQEPAFKNLIAHAGVDAEELGMYYMNSLGEKAEEIMTSEQGRELWTETFCDDLTTVYLDIELLQEKQQHTNHDHHGHDHHHHHEELSAEMVEEDIARGRLLYIN